MATERSNFRPGIEVGMRTDESGEIDLEQIEHNLSLTPEQRLEQYFDWMELMQSAREAGRRLYGLEHRAS